MEVRKTHGFTYEVKENCVTIKEIDGDSDVAEIPQKLDGIPVTGLGEYLFSGKKYETIRIPGGVTKIGRYGFYNCRSLKKLIFTSDFGDMGSGAFTGCHHIRELEIEMYQEESGMKEILSEVREELKVTLTGAVDAILWFPEYYEEGVENTPARILMTQVHGSGLYYRNCFQGKRFNFGEYDRRFEMAHAQESAGFVRELVFGRLYKPWELAEQAKRQYEEYLFCHYEETALAFAAEKREEELEWLLKTYPMKQEDRESYQRILDTALSRGTPFMVSMLMEYGREVFPAKRKSFEL